MPHPAAGASSRAKLALPSGSSHEYEEFMNFFMNFSMNFSFHVQNMTADIYIFSAVVPEISTIFDASLLSTGFHSNFGRIGEVFGEI